MIDELKKKIEEIKKIKIQNKNKELILKIFFLYENIKKKTILEEIENYIKNEKMEDDEIYIIKIRVDSIIEELKKEEYLEKIENKMLIVYKYKNKNIIYIKDNENLKELEKEIIKLEYNYYSFYENNNWKFKKEKNKIKIEDFKEINKIINSTQ